MLLPCVLAMEELPPPPPPAAAAVRAKARKLELAGGRRQGARLSTAHGTSPNISCIGIDDTSTLVWPCMLVLLLPGSAANGFHAGLR